MAPGREDRKEGLSPLPRPPPAVFPEAYWHSQALKAQGVLGQSGVNGITLVPRCSWAVRRGGGKVSVVVSVPLL